MKTIYWIGFYTLLYKIYLLKVYKSIYNTPAYIWYEVHKNKNFDLLIRGIGIFNWRMKLKHPEYAGYLVVKGWENIYNEYVQKFFPKEYWEELEKKFEIARMYFEAEAYNDKSLKTIAKLEEEKLNANKKEIVDSDFYKNCALLQKEYGFTINPLKITIFEYNNNLKALAK